MSVSIPGVTAPIPQGTPLTTRQQQVNYYSTYLAKLPGTYQGNQTAYDGYTWSELYQSLAASDTSADPKQLADAILGVEAAQRTGQNVAASEQGLATFTKQVQTTAENYNLNPLSGLASIGDFFSRLTEGSTWIRIAEGLLGIVLIAVGIARMTHAVPIATSIAKTAGAVAV